MSAEPPRDPLQRLGILNQKYRTELYQLCTGPNSSRYWEIRQAVQDSVKNNIIKGLYSHLFYLLTQGSEANNAGDGPGRPIIVVNGVLLKPEVPLDKVDELVYGVARTLENMLQELVDEILPINYEHIIMARYKATGNINVI